MGNFFGYYILLILQIETRQKKYWKNYFKIYVILIYQIELVLTSHENQKEKKKKWMKLDCLLIMQRQKILHIYCYLIATTCREIFEKAILNRKTFKEALIM